MSHETARLERRREHRVSPKGTMIVRAGTHVIRGRICNLSRSGLLAATRTTAPERILGMTAEVEVRLDGRESSWLPLNARVVRIEANSLALAFDEVPASFTRILDEISSASYRNDRRYSVVLVDPEPARRAIAAEAYRVAGCEVIEVSTPLEAIVRLGESHFEPDLIAIADSLPATISDELRRFVDAEHPATRLVSPGDVLTTLDRR